MKIIPLSLKFLTSRNITTKEIRSNVDELAVEPNIDRWYMIETDGLEHDLDHLKFNLNNLENDENLHSGIIKIGNENIEQVNKECLFSYFPLYGDGKLGFTLRDSLIRSDILISTLGSMYKLHMSFHPLVIWAMICPMAYKIMEKMDLGVMIAPTESSGIPHELKLDESEITIVKSYIETLIPKNIDRFIQEFKYDIK